MAFLFCMIKSRASGRRPQLMYKWWEECGFQAGLSPWTNHLTFLSLHSQMRSIPRPPTWASAASNQTVVNRKGSPLALPRPGPGDGAPVGADTYNDGFSTPVALHEGAGTHHGHGHIVGPKAGPNHCEDPQEWQRPREELGR